MRAVDITGEELLKGGLIGFVGCIPGGLLCLAGSTRLCVLAKSRHYCPRLVHVRAIRMLADVALKPVNVIAIPNSIPILSVDLLRIRRRRWLDHPRHRQLSLVRPDCLARSELSRKPGRSVAIFCEFDHVCSGSRFGTQRSIGANFAHGAS